MKSVACIKQKGLYLILLILSTLSAFVLYGCRHPGRNISSENTSETSVSDKTEMTDELDYIITIDPGHGGFDPGKVSNDGIKEKDINLTIALKLKQKLESLGFTVYLTRETDVALNSPDAGSKKMSDLSNRIAFAADKKSDLFISIHQNSFSGASVHGAQVFYYETSEQGHQLATLIQDKIKSIADNTNNREVKGNSEYLLLAKSTCTSVIVECGFLSNADECARLCSEEYQELLATAISDAVMSYYQEIK